MGFGLHSPDLKVGVIDMRPQRLRALAQFGR